MSILIVGLQVHLGTTMRVICVHVIQELKSAHIRTTVEWICLQV